MNRSVVPPLPRVPLTSRQRQRVLDASMWLSVVGVIAFVGALWGPVEVRRELEFVVALMAVAAGSHCLLRPVLLRWANPARAIELPSETRALLDGTAVSSVEVATGTVTGGGEETDDLRLRLGSRVLVAPVLADAGPRRLAALALTASQADRGSVAPAVLAALVAALAARRELWDGVGVAAAVAVMFVALGLWHAWRGRQPSDAALERAGPDAVLFAFLVLGWTTAARSARSDPSHAADLWRQWVEAARRSAEETDGLTPAAVDAELARLPRLAP